MKIFSPNNSTVNFRARNENVRKADDLQRKSRNVFPMISATYIDDFYSSSKPKSKNRAFAKEISNKIQNGIMKRRKTIEIAREKVTKEEDLLYAFELSVIRDEKTGNCLESAKAALAVLFANGFYNSKTANLYLDIDFINKKTGEVEYSTKEFLNHAVVLTDMNKGGDKNIVIDRWLGFADNSQGAAGRYKQLYDGDLDVYENMHKKLFYIEKMSKGEEIKLDDYVCKMKFSYIPVEEFKNQEDKEKLGFYIGTDYPEALLKKRNN